MKKQGGAATIKWADRWTERGKRRQRKVEIVRKVHNPILAAAVVVVAQVGFTRQCPPIGEPVGTEYFSSVKKARNAFIINFR